MLFALALGAIVLVGAIIGAAAATVLSSRPGAFLWMSADAASLTLAVVGLHVAMLIINRS